MELTEKRGLLIHDVWALVRNGEVKADWHERFNNNTRPLALATIGSNQNSKIIKPIAMKSDFLVGGCSAL